MVSRPATTLYPARGLAGRLRVPGDKSIGHRALMMGALCRGVTEIEHLPDGEDNRSTRAVLRALGVTIEEPAPGVAVVHGTGALTPPSEPLDCGNSGTTMRLMAGLLAGQGVPAELFGDESLTRRPMRRVVTPLRQMGFDVEALGEGGRPPLQVRGATLESAAGASLDGFTYDSPVASAQVKSCVLLAGLRSGDDVVVNEPAPSRDHTELMLRYLGYRISSSPGYARPDDQPASVRLHAPGRHRPTARPMVVPGDISSAAFFLAAGALVEGAEVVIEAVSVNATRTGVLDALALMNAPVRLSNRRILPGGEPVADLHVSGSPGSLRPARIAGALIPRLIDEIPVLAVLAAAIDGETVFADAEELRVKESDRVATTVALLHAAGVDAEARPDGLVVRGGKPLRAFAFDAGHDHRLAMAAAIAGLVADGESELVGAEVCAVSFPDFFDHLDALTGRRGAAAGGHP